MKDALLNSLQVMGQAKGYIRTLSPLVKNQVLLRLSQKIIDQSTAILLENQNDVSAYQKSKHYQKAFEDRLTLNLSRLQEMSEGLKRVAALKDPVNEVLDENQLANGLRIKRVRAPLGLIFLIFESRPNVITEAFSLAFKAGNALILKGGKESHHSSAILFQLIRESLREEKVSETLFWGLTEALGETSRETTDFLIKQNKFIDVLIPRGGDALIEYVSQHSTIPLIKNDRGLCHLYVHKAADLSMALEILVNAKTQRPGVCNAVETLLVDATIANEFLFKVYERLSSFGVQFYVCRETQKILSQLKSDFSTATQSKMEQNPIFLANEASFDTEYLDLKLNIKIVKDETEAIQHIERHGSRHSEAIITQEEGVAKAFQLQVDAAVVYWNASTRFTDGGQFGMGGEIGISTQKLHVRGPVGLEALTSPRWIVEGQGQVR